MDYADLMRVAEKIKSIDYTKIVSPQIWNAYYHSETWDSSLWGSGKTYSCSAIDEWAGLPDFWKGRTMQIGDKVRIKDNYECGDHDEDRYGIYRGKSIHDKGMCLVLFDTNPFEMTVLEESIERVYLTADEKAEEVVTFFNKETNAGFDDDERALLHALIIDAMTRS